MVATRRSAKKIEEVPAKTLRTNVHKPHVAESKPIPVKDSTVPSNEGNAFEAECFALQARNQAILKQCRVDEAVENLNSIMPSGQKVKKPISPTRVLRSRMKKPERRSARISKSKPVDYNEEALLGPRRARVYQRLNPRRIRAERFVFPVYSHGARAKAERKARELAELLPLAGYKTFLPSHVSGGFWCEAPYIIKKKIIEDAPYVFIVGDKVYTVIAKKRGGFSGGWRGLAIEENYVVGDSCVFEWMSPGSIKLHPFRASHFEDGTESQKGSDTE